MGVVPLFFRLSCQLAVNRSSALRAVTTTCTSAGASRSTIRAACSCVAEEKNSWLIRPVPSEPASSATTRSHAVRLRCDSPGTLGSSRTTRLAHRWSRRSSPGRTTPSASSWSREAQRIVWRYDVPVLGSPMWTKARSTIRDSR
jgi:hypothetical protein